MDSQIIADTARATLAGTLPFPEAVGMLLSEGIESYHVDYVAMRMTFYSGDGELVLTPISYSKLPAVARDFDLEALRAAIVDSQEKGQKFRDFTTRAMAAGVQGYIVFLRGQRVIYWGRQGDQHTEWFPGASVTQ